jgi:hypothetical protein
MSESPSYLYGERKHETCRFGTLNQAFIVRPSLHDAPPEQTPTLVPICNWKVADTAPPAIRRIWGGSVEYERDCAVCLSHEPVAALTPPAVGEET